MIRVAVRLDRPGFDLAADFEVAARDAVAVWGPSGAGKTTLLRCLAGLEPACRGRIEVAGEVWLDSERGLHLPAYARGAGLVAQDAGPLPHLSVRENLEFGWRRTPAAQRRFTWEAVIAVLELGGLLDRAPATLSGGERQRLALGRALLAGPRWLLLDEPLSAQDPGRRAEILALLERIRAQFALGQLCVSHRMEDVVRFADTLVVLEAGRVAACGALAEVLVRSELALVHDEDAAAVVETVVEEYDARFGLTHLAFGGGRLVVAQGGLRAGARQRLHIAARDVSLSLSAKSDSTILNRLPARIVAIDAEPNPAQLLVRLDCGGTVLLARISRLSRERLQLEEGTTVWAQVKGVALARTVALPP